MVYNFYEIILLVVLIVSLILKIPINLFNKTFVLGTLVLLFTIDFNTLSLLEWQGIIKILCWIFGIWTINLGNSNILSSTDVLVFCVIIASSIMVSTNNLLALYLCLELQSLSIFIIIARKRNNLAKIEASLKYFILSSISTGLYLLGASVIFVNLGVCDYTVIINEDYSMGKLLIVVALLFKLGASPLHFWVPDVYQGSDNKALLILATLPKLSVFGVLVLLFPNNKLILVCTLLSLIVGSVGAINQSHLNRLLAYSGILATGFILFGLNSEVFWGIEGSLIYLVLYTTTFLIIIVGSNSALNDNSLIVEFCNVLTQPKIIMITLTLSVLSIAGIPPLGGFLAKWVVISSMVSTGFILSSVLSIVCAMIGGAYYLRLVKIMYFQQDKHFLLWKKILIPNKEPVNNTIVLGLTSYFIIFILVFPQALSQIIYWATISSF
uniref:NADH:ubiquinone reductase (H(+)-translocating) n=1 Tax=Cassiopea frondosa TaxID=237412 RepID=G9ISF0_CASFR|nr:NADH dehydrogenase subunit 2 [Cassiopea xamachana]AER54476.1 NADH dehydrogenase subunit 2 [Cassiopea xamachana]